MHVNNSPTFKANLKIIPSIRKELNLDNKEYKTL